MVYTIPPRNAPNATFGNQLGQGISQGFLSAAQPAIQQQYQRGQLQQALNKLRMQGQNPNTTPTDLLYNLIEASSYSPEIGRNLPQLYAELNKAREASAMKNVNFGGEQPSFQAGGISAPTQQQNPQVEQAIRQNQFFPKNIGAQEAPGNLPQEATSGQVKSVLSGDQLLQKTQQRQAELARNGIVKPFNEVFEQVSLENEQNKVYNQQIENERQNRIKAQQDYGNLAVKRLSKVIPDASDQLQAIFRKIGEEAASQGKSEADIDQYITREADKYKNAISNIQKDLQAPRLQNKLQRAFQGKSNDIKIAMQDAKGAIKPLLDLGLHEQARTMLANAGFYPEERENIIFGEMPKEIKKFVDSIPKATFKKNESVPLTGMAGIPSGNKNLPKEYDLKSRIDLFENISKIWGEGENNAINLLQLRKAYEHRGYDWRLFKDAMNELVNNGYIQLNDDQRNTFNSHLNNPPLDKLGQILHGLGLRGR